MKATVILVEGHWNDSWEHFEKKCLVLPANLPDSARDDVIANIIEKTEMFYIFNDDEQIIGKHRDFTIVDVEPVSVTELGALQ